jgi:hypothetical protein
VSSPFCLGVPMEREVPTSAVVKRSHFKSDLNKLDRVTISHIMQMIPYNVGRNQCPSCLGALLGFNSSGKMSRY